MKLKFDRIIAINSIHLREAYKAMCVNFVYLQCSVHNNNKLTAKH